MTATDPAALETAEPAPDFVPPLPKLEAGPILCPPKTVPAEWLDYNGHMNVAYYTMAFDQSLDHVFDDVFGIGEACARNLKMGPMVVQQMIHYVGELLAGETFQVSVRLLDHDAKKILVYSEMRKVSDGSLCATSENLSLNVDLVARRSAPYPAWAKARIEAVAAARAGLERPERSGASIAFRRR